jgi:hypothetical protein
METKIKHLEKLAGELKNISQDEDFLYRVEGQNQWFTPNFVKLSLDNIVSEFLNETALKNWLNNYSLSNKYSVGIILAGNIPAVGFHDILCAYFAAKKVYIKLSSKDSLLTQTILNLWMEIDPEWKQRLEIVERMGKCDKIIATGSNNAFNYFEQYFSKYQNILRRNRTSMAIVHNNISDDELDSLIDDIFLYFGLGCRNVSKLWIERGFELARIFEASERYNYFFNHVKYMNNYDYQRTLLLLNKIPHLSNNFLMLKEDNILFSAISVLNYEYFDKDEDFLQDIEAKKEDLQCVIGRGFIPFGHGQKPSLVDYADGVDTMEFLLKNESIK